MKIFSVYWVIYEIVYIVVRILMCFEFLGDFMKKIFDIVDMDILLGKSRLNFVIIKFRCVFFERNLRNFSKFRIF